jgi:hypothetical protein
MSLARDELIKRYQQVASPTVYDVLDKMGYPNQALCSEIRPLRAACGSPARR